MPLCPDSYRDCGFNLETALYFRRTKTGNVFAILTDYLLQYRKISIPSIGQFELRSQPATLEFGEKLIYPPRYEIVFTEKDEVDPALVEFIGQRQHLDRQAAEDRLKQMGVKLKERLSTGALDWAGFGELTRRREQINFSPALNYPIATPVHAEKVFREKVAHHVLVGDREEQKTTEVVEGKKEFHKTTKEVEEKKDRRYPVYLMVSFAILVLAVLLILWHFYMNDWKLTGSSWNGFDAYL